MRGLHNEGSSTMETYVPQAATRNLLHVIHRWKQVHSDMIWIMLPFIHGSSSVKVIIIVFSRRYTHFYTKTCSPKCIIFLLHWLLKEMVLMLMRSIIMEFTKHFLMVILSFFFFNAVRIVYIARVLTQVKAGNIRLIRYYPLWLCLGILYTISMEIKLNIKTNNYH